MGAGRQVDEMSDGAKRKRTVGGDGRQQRKSASYVRLLNSNHRRQRV